MVSLCAGTTVVPLKIFFLHNCNEFHLDNSSNAIKGRKVILNKFLVNYKIDKN